MIYLCDICGLTFEINEGDEHICPDCDATNIYLQTSYRDPDEHIWTCFDSKNILDD